MILRLWIIALIFIKLLFVFWDITYASSVNEILWDNKPTHLVKPPVKNSADELLLHYVWNIIDYALYFAGLVAVIVIIIWGFRYVTYFWVEDAENQAKMLIINAILWLVIIICSALIVDNADTILRLIIWWT